MNTNPDETKLALWLDDELSGTDLAEMEAWATNQPEQLAAREELRNFRNMMAETIPASEEPPYPDFFMTRVKQGIRELEVAENASKVIPGQSKQKSFWSSWFMPVAACAGMILAFSIGKNSIQTNSSVADAPSAKAYTPRAYTPEEGVDAEWITGNGGIASVIVLSGVSAIPDSTDFSETVYVPTSSEADRTATLDTE